MSMKRTTKSNDATEVAFYFAADNRDYTHGCANLRKWYALANASDIVEGRSWYPRAQQAAKLLAKQYGYTLTQTAAIIAALSPQTPWAQNIAAAEKVIQMAQAGASPDDYSIPAYGQNKRKAHAIALGEPINIDEKSSPKVYSFWQNIMHPEGGHVTIDRHAIKVWQDFLDGGAAGFPPSLYPLVAEDYRTVAAELDLSPAALQAVLWVTYKRIVKR